MKEKRMQDLQPASIWRHFHSLTRIPRPSHHEERIQAFMVKFGEGLGLDTFRDELGNIIIRKPATQGMEQARGVILQGHLDMVPQANADSKHDFIRDPISTRIEGEWISACGTTLGADNGIGVAAAMAVLSSSDICHGPIEALFTSNEEDGMTGACGLKPGLLQGQVLINMDSEDEGVLFVGCAGGAEVTSECSYNEEMTEDGLQAFRLNVSGLRGGHSGLDIHRGRGNANKLLFRLLKKLLQRCSIHLVEIRGGSVRNAIPREAHALFLLPAGQTPKMEEVIAEYQQMYRQELAIADPAVMIGTEPAEADGRCMEKEFQQRLIDSVNACLDGVVRMSDSMDGLVETSSNLGIVTVAQGSARIQNLVRSSVDSSRDAVCGMIESQFQLAGMEVAIDGGYPGWKPDPDSKILRLMQGVYKGMYGQEPETGAIHAGLECGIIGGTYPHLEMISFGPTIRFPHSPNEKMHIPSVGRFWNLLVSTLEAMT
jgi:dipeptidase D